MPSAFIDDGFTLPATIRSETGLFDPFTIEYRPALPKDVRAHERGTMGLAGDKQHARDCEHAAKYLVSWSLCDWHGSPVPLTAANLGKINLVALAEILNRVNSYTQADEEANVKN